MKVVNCTKCNEEYAIDLNKPEEWYCPYCDNLYSVTTDKLSVEKLQEQLNNAKYFFKNILDVNPNLHGGNSVMHLKNCVRVMKNSAQKALAAIEGDENV